MEAGPTRAGYSLSSATHRGQVTPCGSEDTAVPGEAHSARLLPSGR
jgi:hypothetical protein